jgi:ATP-binding cassette subfamily B protein
MYKPWMFIISVLLNIVIFSYSAAITFYVREVLNFVAANTGGMRDVLLHVMPFFLGVVIVTLVRMGAITACALMDRVQDFHYENLLRNNIMKAIYKADNIKNMAGRSEKAFEILDDDVPACAFPSQLLSEVSGFVVYSLIAIASLLLINWKVTIYIFIPLSLAILIIQNASKKLKGNRKANRETHSRVSEMISDTASLVQTIKTSHSEDSVLKHYEKLNGIRLAAVLKDTLFESNLQAVLGSTVYIGTAVMMIVVARNMMQGQFPIGDFSMFIVYLGTLANCVERIVELVSLMKQAEVSYDRIIELVGDENKGELTAYCKLSAFKPLKEFKNKLMERTPLKELNVRNLTYGHDDRNGIYDVSFTLRPGEVLAVAGGVGSGKSTVLNVLMGVVPKDSGQVFWNGAEIKHCKEFFAPPNVAYAPQIARMLSDTIGENLLLGKDVCEVEINKALYDAVFEDDVSEMQDGIDTQAGSCGSMLSGGQRQRLALARMFIHDAEVYIMDDSSSAIDIETEKEFWCRFKQNISKRKFACIIASNKRHVLQLADRVIFMKDGHMEDYGKAEELSKRCEEFANIYAG